MNSNLLNLGWQFIHSADNLIKKKDKYIGRISAVYKDLFSVITGDGECRAQMAGKQLLNDDAAVVVGDWVILKEAGSRNLLIHERLPRKNAISRKTSGKESREQVMVANLNYLFIVQSLDRNFNLRRLERYLVLARHSRVEPVVLLNKCDLCADYFSYIAKVRRIAPDIPVLAVSGHSGYEMDQVSAFFKPGISACFMGSSGVGKSTIVNYLLGSETQRTSEVRAGDSKGRHATTTRQLFQLPNGGIVIDTPGMRELALWLTSSELDNAFDDIGELSKNCLFKDCHHDSEPGCAVKQAIENGDLDAERFGNYDRMKKEANIRESSGPLGLNQQRKKTRKKISLAVKQVHKMKKRMD